MCERALALLGPWAQGYAHEQAARALGIDAHGSLFPGSEPWEVRPLTGDLLQTLQRHWLEVYYAPESTTREWLEDVYNGMTLDLSHPSEFRVAAFLAVVWPGHLFTRRRPEDGVREIVVLGLRPNSLPTEAGESPHYRVCPA